MANPIYITAEHVANTLGRPSAKVRAAIADRIPIWAAHGGAAGITQDARAAVNFIAQCAHETDRFRTTREYGNAAYLSYLNGRADLGNGPTDGPRYPGTGDIQTTGRFNFRKAGPRIAKMLGQPEGTTPDFEMEPKRLAELPWATLSALAYWHANGISAIACGAGDRTEAITRKINGGVNGLADRRALFVALAYRVLGHDSVKSFQRASNLDPDGDAGPLTRAAMFAALAGRPAVFSAPSTIAEPAPATPATPATPAAGRDDRLAALEAKVETMQQALAELAAAVIAQRG